MKIDNIFFRYLVRTLLCIVWILNYIINNYLRHEKEHEYL